MTSLRHAWPLRAMATAWARRRRGRAPRVLVQQGDGHPRRLAPDDPAARAALKAAEALISAAQRASDP